MPAARNSYTFKEGLTMMAAKAVGIDPYLAAEAGENARAVLNAIRNAAKTKQPKDRAGYIREAQNELRTISAVQHPKLVNALQAKLLALQGRGGDTAVAHVEPGEMVLPRAMLTPEVIHLIASEAQRRGIDQRRLIVGGQGSINPATGAEEFGFGLFDTIKSWFGGKSDDLDMTGIDQPLKTERRNEELMPSTLSREPDRRRSILDNTPAVFDIAVNTNASSKAPFYEVSEFGSEPVHKYSDIIESEGMAKGVDPDLVRATMYLEGSHGWYGRIPEAIGIAGSYQPMNIRPGLWSKLSPSKEKMIRDPQENIRAGVDLLSRIQGRLSEPTPDRIATLYNSLAQDQTSDYGARVRQIMRDKPWSGRKPMPPYLDPYRWTPP